MVKSVFHDGYCLGIVFFHILKTCFGVVLEHSERQHNPTGLRYELQTFFLSYLCTRRATEMDAAYAENPDCASNKALEQTAGLLPALTSLVGSIAKLALA